jgi:putative membrane protein
MMNGWGGMGGGGWLLAVLLIVLVAALIVGVVFLVRGLGGGVTGGGMPQAGARESPQDVLKRRYAAGEIEREEYEQKLRDLTS